jgi:hypothetical protein
MVSILSAVRDLDRLRQIYVVLVRHGFGELAQRLGFGKKQPQLPESGGSDAAGAVDGPVSASEAAQGELERTRISMPERVRLVAMDLGPSFVKLGQIASTRPDVIPTTWIAELKKLQDEVRPLPFDDIKAAVEESLGRSLESVYESFDEKPLAAASIGQVHRAVLRHADGPLDVVVKVQRPRVRTTVARDVEILHALASVVERTIPESRIYSPIGLVEQFDRAITSELDFVQEAEHAARFTKNFAGHASVFGEMKPYFFDILRKRYSPERLGNELWRGMERLSGAAYDMPQQMREILDDLRLGRLTLQTSNPALPAALDRLGRSLFASVVVGASVVSGAWLLAHEQHTSVGIAFVVVGVLVFSWHALAGVIRRLLRR